MSDIESGGSGVASKSASSSTKPAGTAAFTGSHPHPPTPPPKHQEDQQLRRQSSLTTSYGSLDNNNSVFLDVSVKVPGAAAAGGAAADIIIASSALPAVPPVRPDAMTRVLNKLRTLPCAGLVLAMLSGVFFATAGFIVKLIPDVNPIEIVISRYAFAFLCCFLADSIILLANSAP